MPPKPPARLATPKLKPRAAAPANLAKPPKPAQHPHPATPPPPAPRYRTHNHSYSPPASSSRYASWAIHGTFFLCGMVFLRDYYIDFQHVKGSSMAPTLNPRAHETGAEDRVVVLAWHAGVEQRRRKGWGVARVRGHGQGASGTSGAGLGGRDEDSDGIRRGDIVTFWKPHRPEEISIKRVVGLPGDVVVPLRGYVLDAGKGVGRVRGLPDGLVDAGGEAGDGEVGGVLVPYGHLWIEGDNWRRSYDSNDFGPISKGLVIGKARWVWRGWWSFGEVGDARGEGERSGTRVVEGRAEVPVRFLD